MSTPRPLLHDCRFLRVCTTHWTFNVMGCISKVSIICLNSLTRTKESYQWFPKYINIIAMPTCIRSIYPHNITRPNVQTDFVTKSRLLVFMAIECSTMFVHLKVCSIASDQTIIAYIISKTIIKYDLIKNKWGEKLQSLRTKGYKDYLLPLMLNLK